MDFLKQIKERRSIRKYLQKPPSDAEIHRILEAGRWAPSGLNNQPWRWILIKDPRTKLGLAKLTKYSGIIKNAPAVILVFLSLQDSYNRDKDLMAIGACIQNMLLEAHALGIGTCWLGEILNRKEEVCQLVKLRKNLECMAAIALGYPAEKIAKGKRKPLKNLLIAEIKAEEERCGPS